MRMGTTIPENVTKTTAKFLTSVANDDLLFEIFARLLNSRTLLHCSAVCTRWRSVVSSPDFVTTFKLHHHKRQQQSPPFTLLLRQRFSQELGAGDIFSDESKTLHGPKRSAGKSKYLDFLPPDSAVRASCKDMILVQLPGPGERFCVCNPLTRQRVLLPNNPALQIGAFAIICHPASDQQHYRVLLIQKYWTLAVAVFRSETGRWDESLYTLPIRDELPWEAMAIGTSDGLVYVPLGDKLSLTKIAALDPFQEGLSYCEIVLPAGMRRGWRGSSRWARLGVVRGGLVMWQSYWDKRMEEFVFRSWRFDITCYSWNVVHEITLARGSEVVVVHPVDDEVVFMKFSGPRLYCHRIGTRVFERVDDIEIVGGNYEVFPVVHQSWPTEIPQLPPSV